MKSLYSFIIKPLNERYDNIRRVDDTNLIINTRIEDHRFISKKALVVSIPAAYNTDINIGDELYVHHNIFRRYYDLLVFVCAPFFTFSNFTTLSIPFCAII